MLWWSHRHPLVHIFLVNFDSSKFFSRYLISTMRSSKILYWTNLNEFSISLAPHSWRQQKEANLGNFVQRFPSNSNPTTDFLDIFPFFQNFFVIFFLHGSYARHRELWNSWNLISLISFAESGAHVGLIFILVESLEYEISPEIYSILKLFVHFKNRLIYFSLLLTFDLCENKEMLQWSVQAL